jgi:hypothetical protein
MLFPRALTPEPTQFYLLKFSEFNMKILTSTFGFCSNFLPNCGYFPGSELFKKHCHYSDVFLMHSNLHLSNLMIGGEWH